MAADPLMLPLPPHQSQNDPPGNMETKILVCLRERNDAVPVANLVKLVGMKRKKEINPTLYKMERKGWVRKMNESPPKWKILNFGMEVLPGGHAHSKRGHSPVANGKQKKGRGDSKQNKSSSSVEQIIDSGEYYDDMGGEIASVFMRGSSGFREGSRWPQQGPYQDPVRQSNQWSSQRPPQRQFQNQVRDGSGWSLQQGSSQTSLGDEMEIIDDTLQERNFPLRKEGASPEPMETSQPWNASEGYFPYQKEGGSPTPVNEASSVEPGSSSENTLTRDLPMSEKWETLEPSKMFCFGRGKPNSNGYPPGRSFMGFDPKSLVHEKTDGKTGDRSQLPVFPHQMVKSERQENSGNPGMGRGIGRLLLLGHHGQSQQKVNVGHHGQMQQRVGVGHHEQTQQKGSIETDLEAKIVKKLSDGQIYQSIDIAKAVLGKQGFARDVNPTLYKLESNGMLQKVSAQPPKWQAVSLTISSASTIPSYESHSGKIARSLAPVWPAPAPLTSASKSNQSSHSCPPLPPAQLLSSVSPRQPAQSYADTTHSSLPAMIPPTRPPSGDVSETMKMMNKNPISAFMEFGQSVQQQPTLKMVGQSGPSHKPKFTFVARVGRRSFPPVVTHNKKEGRREAAEAALRVLAAEGAFQMSGPSKNSQPGFGGTSFYDGIATLAHQAFNSLVVDIPECFSGKKVIAALIMKMDVNDNGRVIALGTGNRCVTGDKLSLEGQAVHDSHAEVITRRAFMRYLYRQLKIYHASKEKSVLVPGPSGKLTLRPGCSLHLYISTAPCGDGAQFSWTDNQGNQEGPSKDLNFSGDASHTPTIEKNIQGLLRTKMELGEGTIPIQEKNPVQTWDAILQNQQRLRTMSCSDKVCRWNILGLQGSLLSNFIDPIYLSSLTLGALYHHGHLSRAVCCRMDHFLKSIGSEGLPQGYRINHPQLGHVTSPDPPRGTEKTKEFSVNWFAGCDNAEATDGTVGRIKGVVPSRLCKKNLLKEFMEVSALYGRPMQEDTYNNIKLSAEDFQQAKKFMKNLFRRGKAGMWVEKPVEVGMFPP